LGESSKRYLIVNVLEKIVENGFEGAANRFRILCALFMFYEIPDGAFDLSLVKAATSWSLSIQQRAVGMMDGRQHTHSSQPGELLLSPAQMGGKPEAHPALSSLEEDSSCAL